jgi:DNA-binding CsgD family transcriptional regulator
LTRSGEEEMSRTSARENRGFYPSFLPSVPLPGGSQDFDGIWTAPTEECGWLGPATDEPNQDLLLRAARRLSPLDEPLARELYLKAFGAAVCAGPSGGLRDAAAVARAANATLPASQSPRFVDQLLDGLIARFMDGYSESVPKLRCALRACGDGDAGADTEQWRWLVVRAAMDLWEDEVLERADGASGGTLDHYDETLLVSGRHGCEHPMQLGNHGAGGRTQGLANSVAEYSRAVQANGLGHYKEALESSRRACAHDEFGLFGAALVELVESAMRTSQRQVAVDAVARLSERTQASGTEWALGVEARSRALVSHGAAAEAGYREAVERLGRTRIKVELARSHLLYGEWLRRENRRVDAREQLHRASELFDALGANAFAERARREVLATGETVRKRRVETCRDLTSQEDLIARLAGERFTNSEIATRLFISPRTVEWHLGKVFTKLGVSSRRELGLSPSERTLELVGA